MNTRNVTKVSDFRRSGYEGPRSLLLRTDGNSGLIFHAAQSPHQPAVRYSAQFPRISLHQVMKLQHLATMTKLDLKQAFSEGRRVTAALVLVTAFCLASGPIAAADKTDVTPAAPKKRAEPEQVLALTPFEVRETHDSSYGVLSSNSVTSFNTELEKLPLSADIFNRAFMDDVHATTVEDMIATYSAGAGLTSADPSGSGVMQAGDRASNATSNTLRGLIAPTMLRDSLMPMGISGLSGSTSPGVSSNFDLERVEIVNGPQSLLYGGGGGGGVINVVSKQARLGTRAMGSVAYDFDQYGHKRALLDFGVGTATSAFRLALLDQTTGGRRVNIGGPVKGAYAQFAFKIYNTIVRISGEHTLADAWSPTNTTVTAVSTANDARNGMSLHYLLATHQLGAAANGAPSGAGPILNGLINWNNVDSLTGWWTSNYSTNAFVDLTADTKWNSWLTSQFVVGYQHHYDDHVFPGLSLLAPNVSSNTTGQWAMSGVPSDVVETSRNKAIRFSLLATNSLFRDRVKSQTIIGADFVREDLSVMIYNYFQADSNFVATRLPTAPAITQNRLQITAQQWAIGSGPLSYPLWKPRQINVTVKGQNYVRMINNEVNPNLVGPGNPTGTNPGGGLYEFKETLSRGLYAMNYSQWLDGKLDTLVGVRASNDRAVTYYQFPNLVSTGKVINYSAGADYAVLPWLHSYFSFSDSFDPPIIQDHTPIGTVTDKGSAVGQEIGLKFQNHAGTISGSIALFHTNSKNEETKTTSTITLDIDPTGLNGRYLAPSNWINVDRKTSGLQAMLTATPTPNWRMRISAAFTDGRTLTTTGFGQLYNDEFHANSQGQITYADGTVVYVPATFSANALSVSSTTPGAQPLTIKLISDPSSSFYANPNLITGGINTASAAAQELRQVDPAHGAILTGRTGLPISALQITGVTPPGFINTSIAGEATVGYPVISTNFTNVYTFSNGPLKGFRVGGTGILGWKARAYYYFQTAPGPGAQRALFRLPGTVRFDPIIGYSHRFRRFTYDTQLNINNVFNHYHVVITPNAVTNFASGANAVFDQQPRMYVWSNTVRF